MPIHRLNCPECGAGLKSAAGFKPGSTVMCPKCETGFEAEEPEEEDDEDERPRKKPASGPQKKSAAVARDDDEAEDDERPKKKKKKKKAEKEWSYRNSWIRYAILGVLVTIMCVMGYMLYLKNEREKRADAGTVPAARPV